MLEAQCRTEEDVVEAGRGVSALLTQYARITAKVLAELPELRMVGRYGVGYDIVDVGPPASAGCGWPTCPTTPRRRWRGTP